jgi:hypothetical protein
MCFPSWEVLARSGHAAQQALPNAALVLGRGPNLAIIAARVVTPAG